MKKLGALLVMLILTAAALTVGAAAADITPSEPATDEGGVYQIGSAAELYWFAQQVNGGDYDAHAVLTADITINKNVLDGDGNLVSNLDDLTQWTPIGTYGTNGEKAYIGTFDGDGHTISGLYVNVSVSGNVYAGLFGSVGSGGAVRDLTIADSYISGTTTYQNRSYAYVGGVCGYNSGTITGCSNSGTVSGTATNNASYAYAGGVCGYNGGGTITGCSNSGTVSGTATGNSYAYAYVGGVCGYNSGGTITDCSNRGAVSGSATDSYVYVYAGGVCGQNGGTIENCSNSGAVSGTSKGNSVSVGGVCGWNGSTITNCSNSGDVSGTATGSTAYVGGVCGLNTGTITNCCWLSGSAAKGIGSGSGEATRKTDEEYASGQVAWLLNSQQENGPWRQTLGGSEPDAFPVLDGEHEMVYQVTFTAADEDSETVYSNSPVTLPAAPSKSGYTFGGWSDGEGNTYNAEETPAITADTAFTAQWTANTYTVQFNANGGAGEMEPQSFTYGVEQALTENAFTKSGCTFAGWNTAADGTGDDYSDGQSVSNLTEQNNGTVTLYAQWTANTYTVTFDANGGAGEMEPQSFTYGVEQALTENAFTKSGCTFAGWNTAADGTGDDYSDGQSVSNLTEQNNDTVTLYAQWTANSSSGGSATYAVTASESGNGTVTLSPSRASRGTTVTVTVTADEGYELESLTVTDSSGNALELTDKGSGKYTFTMPASRVTVEAVFAEIPPEQPDIEPLPFTDVDESAWYAEAVRYVYEHGIMAGYGNNLFGPDNDLSRAQLCQIVYNLEGQPAVTGESAFTDVADGAWYFDAVTWAAANGIVGGYGNGKFGPEDNITREQLAAILYRYAQVKSYDVSVGEDTNILSYTDAQEVSEYAISAMQWACGAGIIEGVTESTLVPQGNSTRAQVATMLIRFCEGYGIG